MHGILCSLAIMGNDGFISSLNMDLNFNCTLTGKTLIFFQLFLRHFLNQSARHLLRMICLEDGREEAWFSLVSGENERCLVCSRE